MRLNRTLRRIAEAGKRGEFISFTYTKENNEVSKRKLRVGGNIGARLARQGTPINGKGSWISSAETSGKNGMIVLKAGKYYVRGTEIKESGESKHKIFLLSGIKLNENE